jgi:hypothetical protein
MDFEQADQNNLKPKPPSEMRQDRLNSSNFEQTRDHLEFNSRNEEKQDYQSKEAS